MAWKFNPFTGKFDLDTNSFRGVSVSPPSSPETGWTYIDSTDHGFYIYYSGTWQLLHTLVAAAPEFILLETGDIILLETGDKLTLEA